MSTFRFFVGLFVAAAFAAWSPAGAQSPPTQPAAGAPDLSTPKAAMLSAYGALRAGDVDASRGCMIFADAAEAEDFDLTITPLWAPLGLMHAMETRFGESARKLFSAASLEKNADQAVDDINHAEITITGDTAVVCDKKSSVDPARETEVTGMTLKKKGDKWRIVASSFPEMSGEIPAAQLPMMRGHKNAIVTACQSTLARLAKGDFKSADEAFAAYQSTIQQASRPAAVTKVPAK